MIWITPPFLARARIMSSFMLRSKPGVNFRHELWLAIIGVFDRSTACQNASSVTCETSTMTPSRFISSISVRPNGLIPPHLRSSS